MLRQESRIYDLHEIGREFARDGGLADLLLQRFQSDLLRIHARTQNLIIRGQLFDLDRTGEGIVEFFLE
jgi:hypothetical protein